MVGIEHQYKFELLFIIYDQPPDSAVCAHAYAINVCIYIVYLNISIQQQYRIKCLGTYYIHHYACTMCPCTMYIRFNY